MKTSHRNERNAIARQERMAGGKPPVSKYAAKRAAEVAAMKGKGQPSHG